MSSQNPQPGNEPEQPPQNSPSEQQGPEQQRNVQQPGQAEQGHAEQGEGQGWQGQGWQGQGWQGQGWQSPTHQPGWQNDGSQQWGNPPQGQQGYPPAAGFGPGGQQTGYPQPFQQGPYAAPVRTDYAPWGKRVGASLIDSAPALIAYIPFIVGYVQLISASVAVSTSPNSTPDLGGALVWMFIGFVLSLAALGWQIYNRWIIGGRTGQSLGKRVTKIRLISEETNQPLGTLNAFVRDLCHILDGFAYVGYLWPLWDEKRQTFADKLMKSVVVDAPLADQSQQYGQLGQPQQYS